MNPLKNMGLYEGFVKYDKILTMFLFDKSNPETLKFQCIQRLSGCSVNPAA